MPTDPPLVSISDRTREAVAFALPLTALGVLWLAALHGTEGYRERGDPGLPARWLHGVGIALPLVLLAVTAALPVATRLIARQRASARVTPGLERAARVAAVAVAAGAAVAVGSSVQAWLFGGVDPVQLPLALHLLRDAVLTVAVAAPSAAAVQALRGRGRATAAEPSLPASNGHRTTRRAFLGAGAAGLTTVAGAAYGGGRLWSQNAQAVATSSTVYLTMNEGYVPMVDGAPVWMRGFGYRADGKPLVPGPPLGPAGSVDFGQVVTVKEGDLLTVVVKNTLQDRAQHTFAILDPLGDFIEGKVETSPGVFTPTRVLAVPATTQKTITYVAPRAGTYIYAGDADVSDVGRLLGLHGTMVVMPRDGTNRPYGDDRIANPPPSPPPDLTLPRLPKPPTFQYQYVWVLHDIDPVWGQLAKDRKLTDANGVLLPPPQVPTFLPRYFTINGASGGNAPTDSTEDKRTHVERELGQATLIRIANSGAAVHSPHFHGNHVFVVTDNHTAPFTLPSGPIALEKDVLRMTALTIKDTLLPCHKPVDQYPPYDPTTAYLNDYPMHCHAEMSQTAGGGSYPSGMLTDWSLETNPRRGRRPLV